MRTKESLGTHYVPAHRTTSDGKLPAFIAYFLPEDCKILTRADYYYVTAIALFCATFFFHYCLLGSIICVVKAKQLEGGKSWEK